MPPDEIESYLWKKCNSEAVDILPITCKISHGWRDLLVKIVIHIYNRGKSMYTYTSVGFAKQQQAHRFPCLVVAVRVLHLFVERNQSLWNFCVHCKTRFDAELWFGKSCRCSTTVVLWFPLRNTYTKWISAHCLRVNTLQEEKHPQQSNTKSDWGLRRYSGASVLLYTSAYLDNDDKSNYCL